MGGLVALHLPVLWFCVSVLSNVQAAPCLQQGCDPSGEAKGGDAEGVQGRSPSSSVRNHRQARKLLPGPASPRAQQRPWGVPLPSSGNGVLPVWGGFP